MVRAETLGDDEKTCPQCAEIIKREAKVCRYCLTDFSRVEESQSRKASGAVLWLLLAGIIGVALVSDCSATTNAPDGPSASSTTRTYLSPDVRAGCTAAIKQSSKGGLVRSMPDNNRVNVDEIKWTLLPADEKAALLSLVVCHTFGVSPADMVLDEYAVAYGWRSGKRLAMLTSAGMSYD